MKKQILTTLIALITCTPQMYCAAKEEPAPKILSLKTLMVREYIKDLIENIPDTYFASEETFTKAGLLLPHVNIEDMKFEIARAYFLKTGGGRRMWTLRAFCKSLHENAIGFSI